MITGAIVIAIAGIVLYLCWQFGPILLKKFGDLYSLDVLHKTMLVLSIIFTIFLYWIGIPAFSATVKFFMLGRTFEGAFQFWIFKSHAKTIGDVIFWIAYTSLWLGVNIGEMYPRILEGNRPALEKMLIAQQAAKIENYDPNDTVQARIIKKKIRKLPGFNLLNANVVCFIGFGIDIAIAFTNTPILKSDIDLTTLILTSAYDQINLNNIGILFLLVAGMTLNVMAFELFSSGSRMIDKKTRSE